VNHNWLNGAAGDALHAILCGAGHNLRMILAHLRVLLLALIAWLALAASITRAAIGSSRRQLLV
jgi:IS5 family transposase